MLKAFLEPASMSEQQSCIYNPQIKIASCSEYGALNKYNLVFESYEGWTRVPEKKRQEYCWLWCIGNGGLNETFQFPYWLSAGTDLNGSLFLYHPIFYEIFDQYLQLRPVSLSLRGLSTLRGKVSHLRHIFLDEFQQCSEYFCNQQACVFCSYTWYPQ